MKTSNNAFTLVEMLVVVSVIGILTSMLLPTLSKGKSKAKRIHCLSNVRQLNIASMCYAEEDRKGYYSPSLHVNDTDLNYLRNCGASSLNCFVCPSTGNRIRPEIMGDNTYNGKPGLRDLIQGANSKKSVPGRSYTIYSFMGDNIICEIDTPSGIRILPWTKKTNRNVNEYAHRHDNLGLLGVKPGPANIYILLDINDRKYNGYPDTEDNHGISGGNVSFCDGHAEWVPREKYFYRIELSQDNGCSKYEEMNQ